MHYFQVLGLSGHPHHALWNIKTTQDAKKLRVHLKFLTGDFLTAERLNRDNPNLSNICKLCHTAVESTEHILLICSETVEVRHRILPELLNTIAKVDPTSLLVQNTSSSQLTQFILDCTSFNLKEGYRISMQNPGISDIFKLSRDWCFAVGSTRSKQLKRRQ